MNGLWSWLPTILLAPLIIGQGKYVRWVTPKLPDPAGARHGVIGQGRALELCILGDSAAVGVGASSQSSALSGRLVSALASDFSVKWQLFAESGSTTGDLFSRLEKFPRQQFDVAIISIGVNDVVAGQPTWRWTALLTRLVDRLQNDFGVAYILLSELPPMHRFSALPQPLRWCIGLRAKRYNEVLHKFVQRRSRCIVIPLDYPSDPGYLATDGFHPGELAYAFWADVIAATIRRLPSADSQRQVN